MNAWSPRSPCTTDCLVPTPVRVPAAVALRRAASLAGTLLGALASGDAVADPAVRHARAGQLLRTLGIRLDVLADPPGPAPRHPPPGPLSAPGPTGTLVVANHISWLDVVALLAVEPVTMLAKRQVADWPLIGTLVTRADTLLIDRDNLRALPATVDAMATHLRTGHSLVVFPQGITRCSGAAGPFHRAVFQAALDAEAPIRPVTVDYLQHHTPTTVAAFVGDDDFTTSLRRVIAAAGLRIRLTVRPPVLPFPGVDDRRTLAARVRATVATPNDAPDVSGA